MTRHRILRFARLAKTLCLALLTMSPFATQSAHACSGTVCFGASVFPRGGNVPRDQAVFTLHPASVSNDAGVLMPRLVRLDGDVRSEVPFTLTRMVDVSVSYEVTFELTPSIGLAPSTKLLLEVEAPSCASTSKLEAHFTIVEALPGPAELGVLRVAPQKGQLKVATRAGSCSDEREAAYADLTVELAAAAQPFAELLTYEWIVDGSPYAGFSNSLLPSPEDRALLPRGTERVYAPCQPNGHLIDDLDQGTHRALVRGKLRSGATVTTPEVSFELRCDADLRTPDASVVSRDAAMPVDATAGVLDVVDATASPVRTTDAGEISPPRRDGPPGPKEGIEAQSDDGCALTSRGGSNETYAAWLGVAVTVFYASRRRR